MESPKSIIALFLGLLLIIIVIGVAVSRITDRDTGKPILGGAVERVLFPNRPTVTPSSTITFKKDEAKDEKKDSNTVIVEKTTESDNGKATTNKGGSVINPSPTNTPKILNAQTKGDIPENIPATGTPTIALTLAFTGLVSGLYLRKRV